MSRPPAPPPPSAAQPNAAVAAAVYNALINAAGPTPRHPIHMPFSGRFRPPGVPPPAPYQASFYPIGRPPLFPSFRPPFALPDPRVFLRPPLPPGGLIPLPGSPFNSFVYPRYITPYPVYRQPLGFPPRPINPPIGVFSHQRPPVIDGTFGPVAVAGRPTASVAPADEPQFTIYVGKIASTVDSDFVLSLLQVCGVVKNWNPVTNPDGTHTAFGFCDFESAEGSLRARRLLNKLCIDGQQLVLNINEATKVYLQKLGENSTEEDAKEAETETSDGMVPLADNGSDSSRAAITDLTERGSVVGGQVSSQGKTKRCRYDTEEYSDSDKDAMQKIRLMIEDRMKSKFPCLPIQQAQPSVSITDEKGHNDMRSSALEERKTRRQCEKKEHLRENRALGLEDREDGEVSPAGKSSLQNDAVSSSTHVSMERESTVEHERKRQRRERDIHMDIDEEKGTVCLPGPVSDKHNSSALGEKVNLESQAISKSGNEETLDSKQQCPKIKEELFAYEVDWAIYDKHGLHEKMRPWISEKTTEIFGEEIPEFVDYVVASTKEHVEAPKMLEALATLMDHSAENFVLSVWTKLISEIKKVEAGLASKD